MLFFILCIIATSALLSFPEASLTGMSGILCLWGIYGLVYLSGLEKKLMSLKDQNDRSQSLPEKILSGMRHSFLSETSNKLRLLQTRFVLILSVLIGATVIIMILSTYVIPEIFYMTDLAQSNAPAQTDISVFHWPALVQDIGFIAITCLICALSVIQNFTQVQYRSLIIFCAIWILAISSLAISHNQITSPFVMPDISMMAFGYGAGSAPLISAFQFQGFAFPVFARHYIEYGSLFIGVTIIAGLSLIYETLRHHRNSSFKALGTLMCLFCIGFCSLFYTSEVLYKISLLTALVLCVSIRRLTKEQK